MDRTTATTEKTETTESLRTDDLVADRRREPDRSGRDEATGAATASDARAADSSGADEPPVTLFDEGRTVDLRSRWETIQASFVDEPREAVSHADGLVAEVLDELARAFSEERQTLEKEWTLGDEVSTEDLRQALRHYRSFFDRLLSL